MCLFNFETKRFQMQNESLLVMLGLKEGDLIENAVLRPKKKKI